MGKQFHDVSSKYGAPMGRRSTDLSETGMVRVFRVIMVDGAYDDGGAYWGASDKAVFCARDENGDEAFTRAKSIDSAVKHFEIPADRLDLTDDPMDHIDEFFEAYVTAALWSSTDNQKDCPKCDAQGTTEDGKCSECNGHCRVPDPDGNGGSPLDENYSEADLSPECLASLRKDCEAFVRNHGFPKYGARCYSDAQKAGYDFFLTQCGHGTGFWDRGLGDVGDKFSKFAKAFGSVDLYVGDDGKIHCN